MAAFLIKALINKKDEALSYAMKFFGDIFRSKVIEEKYLDFEEVVREKLINEALSACEANQRKPDDKEKLFCVLRHICGFMSEICNENNELFRYIMRHKAPLLDPIIVFVRENLLCEDGRNQEHLDKLANCDYMAGEYGISRDEGIAFLKALYMNETGRWIVISLVLRDFLEKMRGDAGKLSRYEDRRKLYGRAFEKLESQWREFKKFVSERWSFLDVDDQFLDDVKFSSVVWEFNYFLHSGERVIRRVLNELRRKRISVEVLKSFEDRDNEQQQIGEDIDFMKNFLESLRTNIEKRKYLLQLIELYRRREQRNERLMRFFEGLLSILRAKRFDFYNAYFRLLEISGRFDIIVIDGVKYLVPKGANKEYSDPAFAGEDTFNDWYYVFRSVVFGV